MAPIPPGVLSERQGFHILALEYFQKALKAPVARDFPL